MSKIWQVAFILFLAAALPNPALGQDPADAAIREVVARSQAAYNAGDADAVAAIYAPDGIHTYATGLTHRGRSEIAQGLREMFAGPMAGARMVLTPTRIRSLTPEIALEEATFSLTGMAGPDGSTLPPIHGFCLAVYQRNAGIWQAAAAQCMVPPPVG